MHWYESGYIVPVAMFTMVAVISVGGMVFAYFEKKLKVEQRLAAIQRGLPLADIEKPFATVDQKEAEERFDPLRRMRNIRLAALILVLGSVGLMSFFGLLTVILRQREILSGVAVAFIPMAIGIGLWIDYKTQVREMERLGLVASED